MPEGEVRRHANGATGVSGVTVVVADLEASIEHYRQLLGDAASEEAASEDVATGARSAGFRLGDAVITLVQPADVGADGLRSYLLARGDGPYSVALRARKEGKVGPLDTNLTHGARLEFFAEEVAGTAV